MRKSPFILSILLFVPLVLFEAAPVLAELPGYSVTKLDSGWLPIGNIASGLNNAGQVQSYNPAATLGGQALRDGTSNVGNLSTPPDGFESFYPTVSGNLTDAGKTVVSVFTASGTGGAVGIGDFASGMITPLAGTPVNGDDDWSPRISSTGEYVVIQAGPDRGQLQPYRYDSVIGWQALGNLFSAGDGRPLDVNSSGTVVGRTGSGNTNGNTVPFLWTAGVGMEAITYGGTAIFGEATAINSNGLVTGTANGRAFVFDGATMELTWITPDGTGLKAYDINDAGAIIGATRMGGSVFGIPSDAAFYWDAENGLTGFDNLIGDAVDDWFITDAADINDNGWVLATGFQRSDSTYHQVLLRPVPEPSVVLLAGVSGLWQISRRKRAVKI
jgi:hypothetical protein